MPCDQFLATNEASMNLYREIERVSSHVLSSWTFGEPLNISASSLNDLWEETSIPNWDGYGAPALSQDVFHYALQFVQTIPYDIPAPEIGASSAGDITFEWAQTSRNIVSVGISPSGEVHFAALNGQKRSFGTFPFDGTFDPQLRHLITTILG